MRKYLLLILLFPVSVFGQQAYKNNFSQGYYVEYSSRPGVSVNYTNNIQFYNKGFLAVSGGFGYLLGFATITGEPNPWAFQNSAFSIPLNVTYNYSIGNFDERIISRIQNKCVIKPPKFNMEWFIEGGGGVMPFFYNKNSIMHNGLTFNSNVGLRTQLLFKRPFHHNDLVVFIKGGLNPNYTIIYPPYKQTIFRTDFSFSVGFGL